MTKIVSIGCSFTNTIANEHPNAEAHNKWAEFLYEKIKQFKYI